jgi:hypothetical protein
MKALNEANLGDAFRDCVVRCEDPAIVNADDMRGSCNLDCGALRYAGPRLTAKIKAMIEGIAKLYGFHGWWGSGWLWKKTFIFSGACFRGQAHQRELCAEACYHAFKDADIKDLDVTKYLQMD